MNVITPDGNINESNNEKTDALKHDDSRDEYGDWKFAKSIYLDYESQHGIFCIVFFLLFNNFWFFCLVVCFLGMQCATEIKIEQIDVLNKVAFTNNDATNNGTKKEGAKDGTKEK